MHWRGLMDILLFVPAHSERFLKSARALETNVAKVRLALDLEDGVPVEKRALARENVRRFAQPQDWIRVTRDSFGTDVAALPQVDGIIVPKAHLADRHI